MPRIAPVGLVLLALAAHPARAEVPVTLRGSPQSMLRQNEVAKDLALLFAQTPQELFELERGGILVRVEGNADYELAPFVSFPHVRPEVRLFIERLAADYHAAVGEKLVVTSLTRPLSRQPRNAHELSVHPAGIAVDLRISPRATSRAWLERALLDMEERGLLDATRERTPPHYHVALFPAAYVAWVAEEERAATADLPPAPTWYAPLSAHASLAEEAGGGRSAGGLLAMLMAPGALIAAVYRRRRLGFLG